MNGYTTRLTILPAVLAALNGFHVDLEGYSMEYSCHLVGKVRDVLETLGIETQGTQSTFSFVCLKTGNSVMVKASSREYKRGRPQRLTGPVVFRDHYEP